MSGKRNILLPAALLCLQAVHAGESDVTTITPSASAYYQVGQLVRTFAPDLTWPNRTWDQRCDLRLGLTAQVREHLKVIAGVEMAMVTRVEPPREGNLKGTTSSNSFAFPREGQGIYCFGDDWDNAPLQIALGYFPFKYNRAASHMGEYLFRTGTYPPFIINDFDNCEARLMGLRVSSTLFGALRQDVLFTSETYYAPLGDYSLSYIAGYNKNVFEIGGGICWSRLVPLDPSQTNTKEIVYDKSSNPVIENGDTLLYTFKGVKLMARGTFDPKRLLPLLGLPELSFFGPEDGKLYFETAILGLKNYGMYFDNVTRRWPYMIGFNIPAFKILDVLSLEMEYFNFNWDKFKFPPTVTSPVEGIDADKYVIDSRFHWSLSAQKALVHGLGIKGLIGKDHYRSTGSLNPWPGVDNPVGIGENGGELLVAKGDWHYTIRIMYSF